MGRTPTTTIIDAEAAERMAMEIYSDKYVMFRQTFLRRHTGEPAEIALLFQGYLKGGSK